MIKKLVAGLVLCGWFLSNNAMADDSAALKQRLSSLHEFSAHFTQKVFDAHGTPLQEGQGDMIIQRPNKFRWETKQPDESLIVSDGKSVWLFDPFVEQVTLMNLSKAVIDTPFLLLSNTDEKIWSNYTIDQNGDAFTVTSKQRNQRIDSLRMVFNKSNQLISMEVNETQGQRSEFTLTSFNTHPTVKASTFTFKTPDGVTVDDQR